MGHNLEYHQSVFELLGKSEVISAKRLAVIEEREHVCGRRFPAAIREWFAIEDAEYLFWENTNNDDLPEVTKLGVPAEVAQGYLHIATENQGVIARYVRLDEGDNPPVYHNNGEWNEDLSKTNWQEFSKTFSDFIFDMFSSTRERRQQLYGTPDKP